MVFFVCFSCRYGRVQSVKFLAPSGKKGGSSGGGGGSNGACPDEGATVAFMDIQSANKALSVEHKFEDRVLRTNYYDPSASYNSDRGGSSRTHPASDEGAKAENGDSGTTSGSSGSAGSRSSHYKSSGSSSVQPDSYSGNSRGSEGGSSGRRGGMR